MNTLSVKWLWIISFAVIVASCTGCSTVRKAYWDHQVKAMCLKDAGVTVYERVGMSRDEFEKFRLLALDKDAGQFYYSKFNVTYIKKTEGMLVRKYEEYAIRKSDGKVLGKSILYSRVGGDSILFSWLNPSQYSCSKVGINPNLRESIFYVDKNVTE